MTTRKTCTKCKQDKELTEFYKDKQNSDERQAQCKACHKAYSEANSERIAAYKKAYREANLEELSAYQLEYKRNRYSNDPIFRQIDNTRCHLRDILHGRRSHQPTLDLLGCTRQEYRDHLESQFTDGMSWSNYGEWHVDHIIPVSAFDQSKLDERAICWHYSNTQPLWAEDNAAKGATIPTESTNE